MRFLLKHYDAEAVAFDTASGDTHYLSPLALTLLQLCREFPGRGRSEVHSLLAQQPLVEAGTVPDGQIDEALDSLHRIGLIHLE